MGPAFAKLKVYPRPESPAHQPEENAR